MYVQNPLNLSKLEENWNFKPVSIRLDLKYSTFRLFFFFPSHIINTIIDTKGNR